MLTHDLHEKTKHYISIYAELKSKLKWKVSHDQILMLISSAYIVNKREFDFQRFYDLSSYIKSNIGSFSTLNSHHRFTVSSILDIHFQHEAKQTFHTFIDVYNEMVKLGYKRDMFTYLSALILLTGKSETTNQKEQMNMGLAVYQQMKKNQLRMFRLPYCLEKTEKVCRRYRRRKHAISCWQPTALKKDSTYIRSAIFWPCKVKKSPKCLFPLANRYINRSLNLSKNQWIIIIQTLLSSHFWKSQISKPFCASLTN